MGLVQSVSSSRVEEVVCCKVLARSFHPPPLLGGTMTGVSQPVNQSGMVGAGVE